jgi:hypothetical protein
MISVDMIRKMRTDICIATKSLHCTVHDGQKLLPMTAEMQTVLFSKVAVNATNELWLLWLFMAAENVQHCGPNVY